MTAKRHVPYGPYECFVKRALDVICCCVVFLLFWWLFLVVALLVRVNLGAPILFKQDRPGKDGKIFKLYKFRTMTSKCDDNGELLPDVLRLTRFGRVLRSTSLDEIPELFNILKGDMSIIGPRPLAVQYLPYYTENEMHRHDVRPGLTGLAQVNGRNTINWEERFAYDVKYVNKITFLGDMKILIDTVFAVFKRKDIGVRGEDAPVDFNLYREAQWRDRKDDYKREECCIKGN